MMLVAIGRTEHEEDSVAGLEFDASDRPWFRNPPWRHPDRRNPARIFFERLLPRHLPGPYQIELFWMGQQRPNGSGDRLARLAVSAADGEFDIGSAALDAATRRGPEAKQSLVRRFDHHWNH